MTLIERLEKHAATWARIGENHSSYRDASLVADCLEASASLSRMREALEKIAAACEKYAHPGSEIVLSQLHVQHLQEIAGKARSALNPTPKEGPSPAQEVEHLSEQCATLLQENTRMREALEAACRQWKTNAEMFERRDLATEASIEGDLYRSCLPALNPTGEG